MARRLLTVTMILALGILVGCGGSGDSGDSAGTADTPAAAPIPEWFTSPDKVVEGLMVAYRTRNDSLYSALLAEDFRYYFVPPGADSSDILGWGKLEDLGATSNLFRTPDVQVLSLELQAAPSRDAADHPEWKMVPVAGGELRVEVADKEAMQVMLNRQEIYVRQDPASSRWQVIAWYDYPDPEAP